MINVRNQHSNATASNGKAVMCRYEHVANAEIVKKALRMLDDIQRDAREAVNTTNELVDSGLPGKAREESMEALREVVMNLGYAIGLLEGADLPDPSFECGAAQYVDPVEPHDLESAKYVRVVLEPCDQLKMKIIKGIKDACGLGLKEAKKMVDEWPSTLKEAYPIADAKALKATLEQECGAKVTLHPVYPPFKQDEIYLADVLLKD